MPTTEAEEYVTRAEECLHAAVAHGPQRLPSFSDRSEEIVTSPRSLLLTV